MFLSLSNNYGCALLWYVSLQVKLKRRERVRENERERERGRQTDRQTDRLYMILFITASFKILVSLIKFTHDENIIRLV